MFEYFGYTNPAPSDSPLGSVDLPPELPQSANITQYPLIIRDLATTAFKSKKTTEIIQPNDETPHEIESDVFKGKCIIKLRTEPLDHTYSEYFLDNMKFFEFQVQGQLKCDLEQDDQIWIGCELNGASDVGFLTRGLIHTMITFLKAHIGTLYYSLGSNEVENDDEENQDDASLVFALEYAIDRFIISKPGENAPPLQVGMLPETLNREERLALNHQYLAENTYSMSLHGLFMDFTKFMIVNFPVKKEIDVKDMLGNVPIKIVSYITKKNLTGLHLKKHKRYLFCFEMEYTGDEIEWE